MNLNSNQSAAYDADVEVRARLVFDDEPLEAILYGAPGPGPSSADIFVEAKREFAVIKAVIGKEDHEYVLQKTATLFETGTAVPTDIFVFFVFFLRQFIPLWPCPLVEEHGVAYDRILRPCFEAGCHHCDATLMENAGMLLYRWYEGDGRYREAADVVVLLLENARRRGGLADEAVLTNDLGYEYLLAQRWEDAAPYFKCATALFERLGKSCEVANIRSNSLTCEAGHHGIEYLVAKKKELIELACTLRKHRDWRVRKPLRLLARVCEYEGKHLKAILYARRAVNAARDVRSRHCSEDEAYLAVLQAKCIGDASYQKRQQDLSETSSEG